MLIETDLQTILRVNNQLPEFVKPRSLSELQSRVGNQFLALVYEMDECPVAFKLGYALDNRVFYSWIGGVLPANRGKGLAQQLLTYQEDWCRHHGYKSIQVKSTNRFRAMLSMLIKNGYNIVSCEGELYQDNHKILFHKDL